MNEPIISILLGYLVVINIISFSMFGIDKYKSMHDQWRIPERTLIYSAVIGGSIGAFIGMTFFRHKTKHPKFKIGIPAILLLQIAIISFLLSKN
ncbi:MAG: DUF1294 domain-containing protein [Bacteroidales bacterium]|nr:DUF1294 domain-containing protein [Bacteroidales bacterium]